MREISSEVATLLKNRSMIGENKPSHEVTVGGVTGSLKNPENWTTLVDTNLPGGNMCETSDGKAIHCYVDGDTVKIAFASSVEDILTQTGIFGTGVAVKTIDGATKLNTSITLINGILYLVICDRTTIITAELWKDTDGKGENFSKMSDITTNNGDASGFGGYGVSTICVLNTGDWGIAVPRTDAGVQKLKAHYSPDKGTTWVVGVEYYPFWNASACSKTLCPFGDGFIFYMLGSSGDRNIMYAAKNDAIGRKIGLNYKAWPGTAIFIDNHFYIAIINGDNNFNFEFYKFKNEVDLNLDNIADIANFDLITSFSAGATSTGNVFLIKTMNTLVAGLNSKVAGTEIKTLTIPVKSININRNKNMAGSLDLSIDNKNGEWSPDNTVNQNVLFPNIEITVKQGYGQELTNTFTGLIDRIEMSTFPQSISLSVRDKLKLALDQTISPQVIKYTEQTVEDIFIDLAGKAGLTVGTVEATGLTIAEKTFSWETYADCFSWLADLVGFEFGCDEDGKVYFKKDAIPSATDWILTFTDGTAQAYFPIVENSEVLKSADGLTTYVKDTDYTIDYDTGELTSLTILDGETLMSYVFAVYSFKEGEDIISLGYTIDDNDIYSKVIVFGKNENDEVISAYKDYVSKDYYNVLSQKIMKIDVSEASTVEQLQAIADRAEMLMRSRVRVVRFAAVAVPWLQVGDLIQVVESSTTISELYRITDLSTNMDSSGYTMQITCYHHSA